jgi:peptidoglycan/LPS O-acetylase OafA/YrhL
MTAPRAESRPVDDIAAADLAAVVHAEQGEPSAAQAKSRSTARFAPFDGIRAVAALLVFVMHVNNVRFPGGWIGVELFFALSGYLITSLLLAEKRKTGRIALGRFYARRALRLVPALAAAVAVVVPLAILEGTRTAPWDGLAAITYTMDVYRPLMGVDNPFGHAWSLAVEEQFYIVWPVLLVIGLRRGWNMPRIAAVLAAASAVVGCLLAWGTSKPSSVAYLTPFPHIPVILGGVGLAFAVHQGRSWVNRLRGLWAPAIAPVIALAFLLKVGEDVGWLYYGGIALLTVPCVLLIGHLVARPDSPVARVLGLRPLVWLGERSYGFYLWHVPVIAGIYAVGLGDRLPLTPVALVATLIMTALSWIAVERPFLRLKRKVSTVHLDPASAR